MAYDSFFSDISTRASTNEILGQVTALKDQAEDAATRAESAASSAEDSAGLASTSATNASTSAGNAAVSESNAAASAATATTASGAASIAASAAQASADAAAVSAQVAQDAADEATGGAQTLRDDLAASDGTSLLGYQLNAISAVLRTLDQKLADLPISIKDFGAVGDYTTDDSDAIQAAINHFILTGRPIEVPPGMYRHTRSFDLPENFIIRGTGGARIAHFPQIGGDKSQLRPGYKHLISGSNFIFDGTATKSLATPRTDRYANISYVWRLPTYTGFDFTGVGFLLDCDVYDAAGVLTTGLNDNKSIADTLMLVQGTLGRFSNCTIFGYTANSAYIVYNASGDSVFDADYIHVGENTLISGGVAIIGTNSTVSTEGLTGNRFVGAGIYGNDHHNRPYGNFNIPAIYIDGNMGTGDQAGIRGHSFTSCNIRTYANDAIVTDHCNDIAFAMNTYEFPALAGGPPGSELTGGFVGTANTRRFRSLCAGATDEARMFEYLSTITGPFQVLGAGEFDTFVCGSSGNFSRLSADANRSYLQLTNNLASTVSGIRLVRDNGTGNFDIQSGGTTRASMSPNGGWLSGNSPALSSTRTIAAGVISVTGNFHGVLGEGNVADDLVTINGATHDGQLLILRSVLAGSPITLKDNTGNLRLAGDFILDSSQDRIQLMWDGLVWCEVSRSNNS